MTDKITLLPEEIVHILSFSKDATAIYTGEDIQVQFVNQAMLDLWGKKKDVLGKKIEDAIPELEGQSFLGLLKKVWDTGKTYEARDMAVEIAIDGKLETYYFDFIYRAILDEKGAIKCILHTATEVSDRIKAYDIIHEKEQLEQQINEALTAVNEEYQTTNEELHILNGQHKEVNEKLRLTNEQLISTSAALANANTLLLQYNGELKVDNIALTHSERKALSLFDYAPIAIAVLNGKGMVIESANRHILEVWGKTDSIIGSPLKLAIPELEGQPFFNILEDVFVSGKSHHGNEVKTTLQHGSQLKDFFFNFVYHPLTDLNGMVQSIMVVAGDVTAQVDARKSVEELNTRLQIALEASGLGSTEVDLRTGHLQSTDKFKYIFGYTALENFTFSDIFAAILPEYRERTQELIENAIDAQVAYHAEYPIRWRDGSVHWVMAHGLARYDDHGVANRLVNMAADITEHKLTEQRKDDFLSIASHELKTPVTSLKAALQLLDRIKENQVSSKHIQLIEQANKSMAKMSAMVDDLLNINRMTEGQFKLEKTVFDISKMLSLCCNHIRIDGKYNLISDDDKVLEIYADEHRIDQVVVNFVNNAVKYAAGAKDIILKAEKSGSYVRISVQDGGEGIQAEVLPRLFERYYRADHSGKSYTGLGLGLFICSEIVKQHGGEIGAESEIGKGSTFWFTIPLNAIA